MLLLFLVLEFLASGRDRGGGVRFFFSPFSSGVGGGQGDLVGTRNNNPGFFSWEGEGEGREKKVVFFGGGGWIEINCTCGPPYSRTGHLLWGWGYKTGDGV